MAFDWYRFFHPYVSSLQDEIEYLKTQVSQSQRKYDNLVEELIKIKTPVQITRQPVPLESLVIKPAKIRGWEDYRTQDKLNRMNEQSESETTGEN